MRPRRLLALGALLTPALLAPALHPSPGAAATPVTHGGPGGRVALDGPWTLRGDRANVGIAHGWGAGRFSGRTVTVPSVTNADPSKLTGAVGVARYEGSIAWYRTRFAVPRAGRYAIDFESVNHRATVWIDGRRIGRSHDGEFQPFAKRFRASGPGEHLLVVRGRLLARRAPEGDGLAPHVVQLRRHQPRGDGAAAGAQRHRRPDA